MTPEQERWAEALQVIKMKGEDSAAFIADRISSLDAAGASAGVARWRAIEERVRAIGQADRQRQ